jgi:YesN/AraC family two-component response regulator
VIEAVGVGNMPIVVFVTAYDRYTLRAFEVHALDYLLKPSEEGRLTGALERAKRELEFHRTYQRTKRNRLLESVAERRGLKRFPIKSGGADGIPPTRRDRLPGGRQQLRAPIHWRVGISDSRHHELVRDEIVGVRFCTHSPHGDRKPKAHQGITPVVHR